MEELLTSLRALGLAVERAPAPPLGLLDAVRVDRGGLRFVLGRAPATGHLHGWVTCPGDAEASWCSVENLLVTLGVPLPRVDERAWVAGLADALSTRLSDPDVPGAFRETVAFERTIEPHVARRFED